MGVTEDRKKEVEILLQDHFVARVGRNAPRKLAGAGCHTGELVGPARELQRRQVGGIDPRRIRDSGDRVLEFIGVTKSDERGNPTLRQQQYLGFHVSTSVRSTSAML